MNQNLSRLSAGLALALGLALPGLARASVPAHLEPNKRSPVIGELESLDRVPAAPWPDDVEPVDGWRPVFYKGEFEVYVPNSAVGKGLAPKPGAPYLLSPDNPDSQLALATRNDEVELVSVGANYSKLRLETVARAYVPDPSASAPRPAERSGEQADGSASAEAADSPPAPERKPEREPRVDSDPLRALEGSFEKASPLERIRHGFRYKIVDSDGERLAFVDLSDLPDFLVIDDYLGARVFAQGLLKSEDGGRVVLEASSLQRRK